MRTDYTKDFYDALREGAERSAKEIIPLVLELIQPKSVIDVGCGLGTWLSVFREYGVADVLGVDGDYVDKTRLEIPEQQFLSFDLRNPFETDRQFDLVVSLEVAEHLPSECAETFVNSLTRLGPVILFSAAIPCQGGTNHVNEQWPDYWVKYFKDTGYVVIDPIRRKIWQSKNIEFWYIQNILMFIKQDCLGSNLLLRTELENTSPSQFSIVHPKQYLEVAKKYSEVAEAYHSTQQKLKLTRQKLKLTRQKLKLAKQELTRTWQKLNQGNRQPDDY